MAPREERDPWKCIIAVIVYIYLILIFKTFMGFMVNLNDYPDTYLKKYFAYNIDGQFLGLSRIKKN